MGAKLTNFKLENRNKSISFTLKLISNKVTRVNHDVIIEFDHQQAGKVLELDGCRKKMSDKV